MFFFFVRDILLVKMKICSLSALLTRINEDKVLLNFVHLCA